jgi:hypothetical protein
MGRRTVSRFDAGHAEDERGLAGDGGPSLHPGAAAVAVKTAKPGAGRPPGLVETTCPCRF